MPRTSQLQTNFNAGELSPNIDARADFAPYFNGSLTLENFDIHPQGWIFRRKGSKFIAEVKTSLKKTRIIPFQFNISQVLVIEIGEGYFRFFANQAAVGAPYEVSNSFVETDLPDIRYIQKDDVVYIIHPSKGWFKLTRLANDNWTYSAVDFLYGPFMDENIVSVNVIKVQGAAYTKGSSLTMTASGGHTPFTANHVGSVWRLRSGTDFAYVKVTAFTSSTVLTVTAQKDISASLQNVNVSTWSQGEWSLERGFPRAITFHEGRLVLAGSPKATQKIWFSVSADFENFETGTATNLAFDRTIAATSNDSILWLFSDEVLFIGTSEGIWRAKASNNSAAMTNSDIGLKRQAAFGSYPIAPIYADDSPLYLQRGKQKIRSLQYSSAKDKYVSEDYTIRSDHITGEGLTELSYQQNPISTVYGVRSDGQLTKFVYESQQEVLAWNRWITDGEYESVAVIPSTSTYDEIYTVVKRNINGVTKRFIEVIEPTYDYSNLAGFFVDCGLTYNGTKSISLTLGAVTGTGITVTAGSSAFSSGDVGKRIHNLLGFGRATITSYTSATVVTVDIIEDFASTSVTSWGLAVNQVGGLTHLIGETVSICGDGATIPDEVVNGSGVVSFDTFNTIIHAGLKYTSTRKSMPLEMQRLQAAIGSSQGKKSKLDTILIRFFNARGGKVLDCSGKEITINSRSLFDSMDKAPELSNEDREIEVGSDWSRYQTLSIIQDEPQPMNIKSITYFVSVNDV